MIIVPIECVGHNRDYADSVGCSYSCTTVEYSRVAFFNGIISWDAMFTCIAKIHR